MEKDTFYFGKVQQNEDIKSCFKYDGNYYYYKVEHRENDGDIVITDTVGRSIPIDIENIDILSKILDLIYRDDRINKSFTFISHFIKPRVNYFNNG